MASFCEKFHDHIGIVECVIRRYVGGSSKSLDESNLGKLNFIISLM